MLTPKLLSHGERIRAEYAAIDGDLEGAAGRSTDEERKLREQRLMTRFSRSSGSGSSPMALGWIRACYADAIEYTSMTRQLKGMAFFWGLFYGIGLAFLGTYSGSIFIQSGSPTDLFPWFLALFSLPVFFGVSAFMFAFMFRIDLFRPSDLPIIFDRKHRKVYRLLRDEKSGFKGAFRPWPILACQYDWDLIDAEHHREIFTTGGSVNTNHFLVFLVRKSVDDSTIIDSFTIAHPNILSNDIVGGFWEHIRRFMEENGPHLPSPDEPLADMTPTTSWWHSMGTVGPFGAGYRNHWRNSPVYSFFMHLFLPLSLPFFLIWGTGNYLSYRTAIKVQWPAEVLNAIGPGKV